MQSTNPDDELYRAVSDVEAAEEALVAAQERHRKAKEALVALLNVRGEHSSTLTHDGYAYKVTVVSQERVSVDEEGIRTALTDDQMGLIVTPKVDKGRLEAAIVTGLIEAEVVAPYLQIKATNPFPRITKKIAEEDE